jgi:hypothetical protein
MVPFGHRHRHRQRRCRRVQVPSPRVAAMLTLLAIGPLFLIPGLVIALHVCGQALRPEQAVEMRRYLLAKRRKEGGWGLYVSPIPSSSHHDTSHHITSYHITSYPHIRHSPNKIVGVFEAVFESANAPVQPHRSSPDSVRHCDELRFAPSARHGT